MEYGQKEAQYREYGIPQSSLGIKQTKYRKKTMLRALKEAVGLFVYWMLNDLVHVLAELRYA